MEYHEDVVRRLVILQDGEAAFAAALLQQPLPFFLLRHIFNALEHGGPGAGLKPSVLLAPLDGICGGLHLFESHLDGSPTPGELLLLGSGDSGIHCLQIYFMNDRGIADIGNVIQRRPYFRFVVVFSLGVRCGGGSKYGRSGMAGRRRDELYGGDAN